MRKFLFIFLFFTSGLIAQTHKPVRITEGGTNARTAGGAVLNLTADTAGKVGYFYSPKAGGGFQWTGASALAGTVAIANGGTGATTAAAALVSLLPDSTGNSAKAFQVLAGGGFGWGSSGSPWIKTNAGSPPNPQPTALGTEAISMGSRGVATGDYSFAIANSYNGGQALSVGTISIMGYDLATSQINNGQHGYNILLGANTQTTAIDDALNVAIGYNVNVLGNGNVCIGGNVYNSGSAAGYGTFLGYGIGNEFAADAKYITIVGATGTVASGSSTATLPHLHFDTAFVGGTTVGLYARNAKSNLFGDANDTTVGGAFSNATRHILDIGAGGIYGNPSRFNALTVLMNGNVIAGGTITATNFSGTSSGTNTGDKNPNVVQNSPADPTGTTSATPVMMGLAQTITPSLNGKVLIIISGNYITTSTTATDTIEIRYGTGSAPANGVAATGTRIGTRQYLRLVSSGTALFFFSTQAVATGLTVSTPYWFDVALTAGGLTETISNLSVSIVEF